MRLSRARRVIECVFGILNAKFQILWKPIETKPDFADKIIKCACLLHNIIIDKEGLDFDVEQIMASVPSSVRDHGTERSRENNRATHNAAFVRDTFKNVCLPK